MLLTALEQAEFDDLVDFLEDPNLLGFARRIPESRHYRKPPVGCPPDIPMPQAVRECLQIARDLMVVAMLNA